MELSPDQLEVLEKLLSLENRALDVVQLAILGDLDPRTCFAGGDWRDVDFGANDLSGFDLRGADLRGADLSRATGLDKVIVNQSTLMPDAERLTAHKLSVRGAPLKISRRNERRSMTKSPYLLEGRLQQIIVAIQFMAVYRSYRLTPQDWAQAIGYPLSAEEWAKVFKDHPEFFRESPSRPGQFALGYRRALRRLEDDNRPPLRHVQVNALIDLALRLYGIANGLDLNQHTIDRSRTRSHTVPRGEAFPAFICYDARDKASIALPLALEMQRINCPVAVDYFSLGAGDSLPSSIERGLKECGRCILVITSNFLNHGGWAKEEYEQAITHELVEVRRTILPVLHAVDLKELREYSPILADHVNLRWSMGVEYVAQKLKTAIQGR